MSLPQLLNAVGPFSHKLYGLKNSRPDVPWYPFNTLDNFRWFEGFSGAGREVFSLIRPQTMVADIGAGDGDLAFFIESMGARVNIIDNVSTNANDCRGILEMRAMLGSKASVQLVDLDWLPWLAPIYDLIFFLGTLYHVRNPAFILNTLAHSSQRLLLSTKIFFRLDESATNVEQEQLSYFADRREIFNDPTIYWLFTPEALRILLRRSGWVVLDECFTGDADATPRHGDARMFCYCERVPNWQLLRAHHDF